MTITTITGTKTFTESQLAALSLRFVILSTRGIRRHFVDGVEVLEADYQRAFETATTRENA